jgi:hypothetical protein
MYFWQRGMYATSQIVVPRALQRKKAARERQRATTGGLNIQVAISDLSGVREGQGTRFLCVVKAWAGPHTLCCGLLCKPRLAKPSLPFATAVVPTVATDRGPTIDLILL